MKPVLLVTGASRGIGAASCILAAQKGWDVAVNYTSNAQAAGEVVQQVKAAGGRAIAVQADRHGGRHARDHAACDHARRGASDHGGAEAAPRPAARGGGQNRRTQPRMGF